MKQYHELGRRILQDGVRKQDRTGTGTLSVFGHQMRFDLSKGLPLVTTKDMEKNFRLIVEELLWFLRGETDITKLIDRAVNIWTPDGYRWYVQNGGTLSKKEFTALMKTDEDFRTKHGDLGPIYGKQWRSWGETGIDQIKEAEQQIAEDPDSRRIIVNAWNPAELSKMALPPCHVLFQFYVANGRLSCQLYQRSVDYFLGLPFNIASYAITTELIARKFGLEPGEFIHTSGDAHIYLDHIEQVVTMLGREPYPLPQLRIHGVTPDRPLEDYTVEDFELVNYLHHDKLTGNVSAG